MTYRIGIDVGGTFTDFLLLEEGGQASVFKVSTTPEDPSVGVLAGLKEMSEEQALSRSEFVERVDLIVHGTTVATNAILTMTGANSGLLTTEGFRDSLQMRRGIREAQYDNRQLAPEPLVPRYLRCGIRERISVDGGVRTPLDEEGVRRAAETFRTSGVASVAVCFMHAYANSSHELRAADILREELPEAYLSLSSKLLPQIRFYDRTSTTVVNSYVGPLVKGYLEALLTRLSGLGFKGRLLIMQSNGGVATPETTMNTAAATVLSGPAAAPIAGLWQVHPRGQKNCITADMGGTSFDASLVVDGQPFVKTDGRINGHLLALPMLDIHTIGAGGGSIGWVDSGGLLRMGPHSAGANPGPACYGRGGEEATCTDADLVLGYLNPDYFLGGKIALSMERASRAIKKHVATPLGLSVEAAAAGMFRVINSAMADGIREISVKRGHDPRDFPLVVAGGAGPVHAAVLARELELPFLVIPRTSSILCASGMLLSDLKYDYVRTAPGPIHGLDPAKLRSTCLELQEDALRNLSRDGVSPQKSHLLFSMDFRYIGQHHEVNVSLLDGEIERLDLTLVAERFHGEHDRLYGYSVPENPTELVSIRLTALGETEKPTFQPKESSAGSPAPLRNTRRAYLPEKDSFEEIPVYDGDSLGAQSKILGPAMVEQITTTVFVPSDYELTCGDRDGSFTMTLKEFASQYSNGEESRSNLEVSQ